MNQSKATIKSSRTIVSKAQEASYTASLLIAKAGKPHNLLTLCIPLAKEITRIMCGEKTAKQLDLIPFSLTGSSNMADDSRSTLIERIKISRCFSLQSDETNDVTDLASLLVYICYEFDSESHEDLLFSKPLLAHI